MQSRHFDNRQYFNELVITSQKFFLPYIESFIKISDGLKILEIGCGEGGILLPFARKGCSVVGVDLDSKKIDVATSIFAEEGAAGRFIAEDVLDRKSVV